MASARETNGPPGERVLTQRMALDPARLDLRGRPCDRRHEDDGALPRLPEGLGPRGATRLGGLATLSPAEDRGPGARDARAEGSGREGGGLHVLKAGNQRRAARLDEHVIEPAANEVEVALEAPGEHEREVLGLSYEV